MTLLVRLAELVVFLFFVAWTVVFPLATLLSLVVTLPLLLLITRRTAKSAPQAEASPVSRLAAPVAA